MKRFTLLIIFFIFSICGVFAQNISVKSFKALPMDLTASSLEGKRVDQNGDVAALIKVVTTETGFVFEGGTLGIVDTKQTPGEVWVWVPRAARKITIKHPKLGVLRDYYYPVEIEAERTYEMVLTTAKIETIVKEEVTQQYLIFELEPKNATLDVNDKLWSVDADGIAMQYVEFGSYTYRVRAANYNTDAGVIDVNDPDNPVTVKVSLQPNLAEVTLTVDADAEIWVNNVKKGVRSWTGPLGYGTYRMECRQEGHETTSVSKEITAEMSGQTITLPAPRPIYGSLSVETTPNLAILYIDGKEIGKTPRFINEILVGQHEMKLVKEGYAEHIETIKIANAERKQVKVTMESVMRQVSSNNEQSANDNSVLIKNPIQSKKDGTFLGVNLGVGWSMANIYHTHNDSIHDVESGAALSLGFDCAFPISNSLKVGFYSSVGGAEGDSWYYGNWDFKLDVGLFSIVNVAELKSFLIGLGVTYSDNFGFGLNGRFGYKFRFLYINSELYYVNWKGSIRYGNCYGILLHLGYQFNRSNH